MEKVKVIVAERFRDGGTIIYTDQQNRLYFCWQKPDRCFNAPPGCVTNGIPAKMYAKQILVELEVVEQF
jgi:hypothetical protein